MLLRNGFSFLPGNLAEDQASGPEMWCMASRACMVNRTFYVYRERGGSLSHSRTAEANRERAKSYVQVILGNALLPGRFGLDDDTSVAVSRFVHHQVRNFYRNVRGVSGWREALREHAASLGPGEVARYVQLVELPAGDIERYEKVRDSRRYKVGNAVLYVPSKVKRFALRLSRRAKK